MWMEVNANFYLNMKVGEVLEVFAAFRPQRKTLKV